MNRTLPILFTMLRPHAWVMPMMILLGTVSSLAEGLGISLFIPLLQGFLPAQQPAGEGNFLLDYLSQWSMHLPVDLRFRGIAIAIFLCILLKVILTYSNSILLAWFNALLGDQLRTRIFHQLLHVRYRFLETADSGQLINVLATETWQVGRAIATLVELLVSICTILVFASLLLVISWRLTVLAGLVMVGISLLVQYLTQRVERLGEQAVQVNAGLTQRMWEGLSGMRLIRACGREHYEQRRFDRASAQVRQTFLGLEILSGVVAPLSEVLSAALLLLILVMFLGQNAVTNLPVFLTFVFVLYRLQPQVKVLDGCRIGLLSLAASVAAVAELLSIDSSLEQRSGQRFFSGLRRAIAFDTVSFRYNEDEPLALQEISLQIPWGKTTALVGPSGAGKSTLIDLIGRYYQPSQGEIRVDGVSLADYRLADWRDHLAIVSQEVYLFSTTIRENIAYGRLDATDNEIIAAAVQANAHEFIMQLPEGYETAVGDRGSFLSGGQRQRIALARAILRNPDVLILDEATNALDSISEHFIQESLEQLRRDRTVIVVAHRLSTIAQADQIIVLDQGRVVEQGNLTQLLNHQGLFARMYQLQNRSIP